MTGSSALPSIGLGGVKCSAVLWRFRGKLMLSAIVKASFQLDPGRYARPGEADEILDKDQHFRRNPANSVEQASEIAPYKPRGEVLLMGHAYAPPEQPVAAVSVRLAIFGASPIVEKTLHIYGDRPGPQAQPAPFRRMPLVYERAAGGPGTGNPVGISPASGAAPNIIDPRRAGEPAGFGPLSRYWKVNEKRPIRPTSSREGDAEVIGIPDDFDWDYYLAAPMDQRGPYFRGDEWIVLDGMHPTLRRLQTRLPAAVAEARLYSVGERGASGPGVIALCADTLDLNADLGRVTLLWRGSVSVEDLGVLRSTVLVAGLSCLGERIAWPSGDDIARRAAQEVKVPAAPPAVVAPIATPPVATPAAETPPKRPAKKEATRVLVLGEDLPSSDSILPFHPAAPGTNPSAESSQSASHPLSPDPNARTSEKVLPFIKPAMPWERSAPPPLSSPSPSHYPPPETYLSPPPAEPPMPPAEPLPLAGPAFAPWDRPHPTAPPLPPLPPTNEGREPSGAPKKKPPRDGAPIPVVGSPSLVLATFPWQVKPPQDSLTVIVKGTFDIIPDQPATLRPEGDFPVGDIHIDDDPEHSLAYASDFAVLKPKADVTLVGRAHAPRSAKKTPAMQVEFRFGDKKTGFARSIAILGDRRWEKTALVALAPTEPEPFDSIPLIYERAFGGPGYDENPVGAGYKAREGSDGIARLPNLESPGDLVTSPSDEPPPACFAPIPMAWRERWSKMGTYDYGWFRKRWPYFPEDFDWTHYQAAPRSQQLENLRGDEHFSIIGMTSVYPRIDGRLPGIRARCFAQKTEEAGGDFYEVALRLDTAAFDAEAMKLSLVWRGLIDVSEEEAPEIEAFFVMHEPLEAPKIALAAAHERYITEAAPKSIELEDPDAEPAPTEGPKDAQPTPEEEISAQDKEMREKLMAAGVPEEELSTPDDAAVPPPPDPKAIAETMRALGAEEEQVAEVLELLAPIPEDKEAPATPDDLRARAIAMLRAGESFDGFDGEGADLSDLDFAGRSLKEANLRRASLARSSFEGADLKGALLSRADASAASFEGADLTEADLAGAKLDRARFAKAKISRADFTGASAEEANFDGASGDKPQLVEAFLRSASFEGASLTGADLTRASLDGASMTGAVLTDIRLYFAEGTGVSLDRANLTGARCEGVKLLKSSLQKLEAPSTVWERAVLNESTFQEANLKGSSFNRATCLKTVFSAAEMSEARCRRAKMMGASFVGSNLLSATFERADLTLADMRGANLHAAETWRAKLELVKLEHAIVTQSKLKERK